MTTRREFPCARCRQPKSEHVSKRMINGAVLACAAPPYGMYCPDPKPAPSSSVSEAGREPTCDGDMKLTDSCYGMTGGRRYDCQKCGSYVVVKSPDNHPSLCRAKPAPEPEEPLWHHGDLPDPDAEADPALTDEVWSKFTAEIDAELASPVSAPAPSTLCGAPSEGGPITYLCQNPAGCTGPHRFGIDLYAGSPAERGEGLTPQQITNGVSEARRIISSAVGYRFAGELVEFSDELRSLALRALRALAASRSASSGASERGATKALLDSVAHRLREHCGVAECNCSDIAADVTRLALSLSPAPEDGMPPFDYPAAARSIALNLGEFCDESEPFPRMIAAAARHAADEIHRLRESLASLRSPEAEGARTEEVLVVASTGGKPLSSESARHLVDIGRAAVAHDALRAAALAIVAAHGFQGSKQGRADYTAFVSLDKIDALRNALGMTADELRAARAPEGSEEVGR